MEFESNNFVSEIPPIMKFKKALTYERKVLSFARMVLSMARTSLKNYIIFIFNVIIGIFHILTLYFLVIFKSLKYPSVPISTQRPIPPNSVSPFISFTIKE